ncbi:MAG TPA: pyridoxal-phosphate dependent enzyme, partial [Candidatus Obscuribacter sp.]|nr:pyridoxal-phosphate dependent enzyme [Candidatus Obscuribacter sp.]
TPGSYKVEGIGEDFIPRNADLKIVDHFERISDKESFQMARRLAREEGLLVGGSCGTATCAALRVAETMTEEDVIVVILPDGGRGYLSKVYSDDWMRDNGFLPASGMSFYAKDLIAEKIKDGRVPPMITVKPDDTVQHAIDLMEKYQIDQLPVITEAGQNVGHINDLVAMQIVFERKHPEATHISSVMGRPYPQVDSDAEIDHVYRQFKLGTSMVILTKDGKAAGVLTKFDIVQHLKAETGAETVKHSKKEKASVK